jgi:TonB family protein
MPGKDGKKGYRGGFFDQIDVPAVTSFLACALLFVLVLVGVKSVDYSSLEKTALEDLPARVAKILMPQAAVLSILSGTGPATQGRAVGRAPKGGGFSDWGNLDQKLGKLEGLTKFDAKTGDANRDGIAPDPSRDAPQAEASGIDKLVKGFQNAKRSALTKIGTMEVEKPELVESKYTGARNLQDIATFINKKQAMVSMLYEERLRVNPSLQGKITVVLVIEEDGTVSSAGVLRSETTLEDADFQNELLRRIKRWIFPPSTGGPVEMKSPFVFRPA